MHGVELSRGFYAEVVAPLLEGVPHAAGRLGQGSDVFGLDDEMSRDHDWGCRLTVLVAADVVDELDARLERELPESYEGMPVRFPTSWKPEGHQVWVSTVRDFARHHLGMVAPDHEIDWLLLTGQSVLEVIAGPVFHDDWGELTALRSQLQWYPEDVERYLIAASWLRIDQELPFVGRTRDRGDLQGSEIIIARLARAVMHLTFLYERRWPPYAKWFGTAYGSRAPLDSEAAICAALDALAGRPVCVQFHDRPFATVDPLFLASIPSDGIGSVEMWCDNVDVLAKPWRRMALRGAYEAWRT